MQPPLRLLPPVPPPIFVPRVTLLSESFLSIPELVRTRQLHCRGGALSPLFSSTYDAVE